MAALAAPPCELAAYGLHAGGLQALVHARVPHRRYAGMRGGQVVEAGEHLAPRAVRAAQVRLALAHSVCYEAGPLVALLALPPDALVGVGDHVGRLQVAVALLVPVPRDLGMRRPRVVEAAQQLAVLAVRAAVVDAHGAHAHLLAPDVAARSAPPHPGGIAARDVGRLEVPVPPLVPLPQQIAYPNRRHHALAGLAQKGYRPVQYAVHERVQLVLVDTLLLRSGTAVVGEQFLRVHRPLPVAPHELAKQYRARGDALDLDDAVVAAATVSR